MSIDESKNEALKHAMDLVSSLKQDAPREQIDEAMRWLMYLLRPPVYLVGSGNDIMAFSNVDIAAVRSKNPGKINTALIDDHADI